MTKENFRKNSKQFLLGLGIHFGINILNLVIIAVFFTVRNPNPILFFSYTVFAIIALLIIYFLIKKQWYIALGIFSFFFLNQLFSYFLTQSFQQ